MLAKELKQFLDNELEKAEASYQETLKRHIEIMDACERMKKAMSQVLKSKIRRVSV